MDSSIFLRNNVNVIPTEHRHFHGIYFPLYPIIFLVMCNAQLLLVNGLKNNAYKRQYVSWQSSGVVRKPAFDFRHITAI